MEPHGRRQFEIHRKVLVTAIQHIFLVQNTSPWDQKMLKGKSTVLGCCGVHWVRHDDSDAETPFTAIKDEIRSVLRVLLKHGNVPTIDQLRCLLRVEAPLPNGVPPRLSLALQIKHIQVLAPAVANFSPYLPIR